VGGEGARGRGEVGGSPREERGGRGVHDAEEGSGESKR
jgi:hypothetical protein